MTGFWLYVDGRKPTELPNGEDGQREIRRETKDDSTVWGPEQLLRCPRSDKRHTVIPDA